MKKQAMKDTADVDDMAPTQDRVIARLLIDDIVAWRIAPGSWLREREVAQRFGVSHAPVREAFRHIHDKTCRPSVPLPNGTGTDHVPY